MAIRVTFLTLLADRHHHFFRFVLVLNEVVLLLEIEESEPAISSTGDG